MEAFEAKREVVNMIVTLLTLLRDEPAEAGNVIAQIAREPAAAYGTIEMFAAQLLGAVQIIYGDKDDPLAAFALAVQQHILDEEEGG